MKDKRILITGGAGGLGAIACWAFAAQGAHVVALDRGDDLEERIAAARGTFESLRASASHATAGGTYEPHDVPAAISGSVRCLAADLADTPALTRTIRAEIDARGGFDILINNAAIYPSKPFLDYAEVELRAVHAVNTHAPLVLAQLLVPHMQRQHWGRIVNISSITFYGGWGELLPYVTSKGALVGATRALARELGVHGITVNCVSPGAFPTAAEAIHPDPEGYQAMVIGRQSIKHRGNALDIANALQFFASEHSGFVTGQVLAVDGGWYMN
ncbi:SDR family NAD(P)-dependent oxidoreductase [Pararobbsia silviterrae]|uniref:SDR family oxidoreductase n=1 Tax=Pararobbsia silviterrae TaxID=1792498 RepID=A0A494XGG3_9BURK|nr:SDR family oxidoreductase [Pararobbsia silviterrae]RKP47174.1 SDR family oxidoreductase [Pararobbsia silviterrae]